MIIGDIIRKIKNVNVFDGLIDELYRRWLCRKYRLICISL